MTARGPLYVQLGLFGGPGTIEGTHRVAAHTRVLADGTEVQVCEHLRWNRPRRAHAPPAPCPPVAHPAQPSLFDAPTYCLDAIELWPGAWQLPLWPRSPR